MRYAHIITNKAATVFDIQNPSAKPVSFDSTHAQYQFVVDALRSGDEQRIEDALSVENTIAILTDGQVQILEDSLIMVDGEIVHNSINNRIIENLSEGYGNLGFMLRFLENVVDNPSKDSANELFEFLEHCDLPLTHDGHFLAYKMVREDYMDQYSGTINNSVGQVVEMARERVNPNREETCSTGLHFASLRYIHSDKYGHGTGSRLMVLKINPRDVVSIPNDYNFSKGRCCRYEVVGEIESPSQMPKGFTDQYDEPENFDMWDDTTVSSETTKTVTNTVLNEDVVNEIHKLIREGYLLSSIERKTGVSTRHIARLRDNQVKAWEHLHPSNKVPTGKGHLDESTVKEVFSLLSDKWTLRAIEQATGVSRRQIARLRDGEVQAWNYLRTKYLNPKLV